MNISIYYIQTIIEKQQSTITTKSTATAKNKRPKAKDKTNLTESHLTDKWTTPASTTASDNNH